MEGFQSHVVIDYNEYSVIDERGMPETILAPEFEGKDFHASPMQPHPVLGARIGNPRDGAEVAKRLNVKQDDAVLIGTRGPEAEVQLLTSIPNSYLQYLTDNRHDPDVARDGLASLRQVMRTTGSSSNMFLASSLPADDAKQYGWLVESGLMTDIISQDGQSLRDMGISPAQRNPIENAGRPMWMRQTAQKEESAPVNYINKND